MHFVYVLELLEFNSQHLSLSRTLSLEGARIETESSISMFLDPEQIIVPVSCDYSILSCLLSVLRCQR